jgi:hypothetical protein
LGDRAQKFLSSPIYLFSALARIFVLFSCAKEMHDMQNTTEDADVVATTVRFPRALRRRLEDAARSSFRPLSGEIAHRIKLSFEQPPDEATAS